MAKGLYRESFHARYEHPERKLTTDDVVHGLERKDWSVVRQPNWDDAHKNWEYLIKTKDVEGDELRLKIAVFPEEGRFTVITRW